MKVCVVGAGFVGEATGGGIAKHNHEVVFVDTNKDKVNELRGKDFSAFTPEEQSKITTNITMISVPTPTEGDKIDLSYLEQAVENFARLLASHNRYHVLVIRSTVPPGTTRQLVLPIVAKIAKKKVNRDFGLVMQPEYLREKTARADFERPWIIVIGEHDSRAGNLVHRLYKTFDAPIVRCGLEEAEFQKYMHNVYNAVKIAFFNELRIICRQEGWDADALFRTTALSAESIWNPVYGLRDYGPFDGACLPKDTRSLLEWADKKKYDMSILQSVIKANLAHEKALGKNHEARVNYLERISV